MANPSWPASLPAPADEAAQYAPLVDNVITSQVETGAPKRRRRFTAVPETFTCTLTLTSSQQAALDAFVVATLKDVLPFDWIDWRNGDPATYVFQKRPIYSRVPGSRSARHPHGLWNASLELLRKP